MVPRMVRSSLMAGWAVLALVASAQAQPLSATTPPPAFPHPAAQPPSSPSADMQAVLDAQAALGLKPIETLTAAEARRQPTPADGVKAVLRAQGRTTTPDPSITTRDFAYASDPNQTLRVYTPDAALHGPRPPVIVYFHGGGWVIADLDTYDATPRALAAALNAIVVSVDYRHAPEHPFPAQQADANYAYDWILAHLGEWRGDRGLIVVAGESAGGNLAVNVAIHARDVGRARPKAVLAVYPIATGDPNTPSKRAFANAKPLNTPMLQWFAHYAAQGPDDMADRRWDLTKANLQGLGPVTIVNAEIDPLRDDGSALEQALKAAGNGVERRVYPGVTHEFFGMGQVVRGAYDANLWAVARMKRALDIQYQGDPGTFTKAPSAQAGN